MFGAPKPKPIEERVDVAYPVFGKLKQPVEDKQPHVEDEADPEEQPDVEDDEAHVENEEPHVEE